MQSSDVEGKNAAVREAEARMAALESAFEELKGAKERAVAMQVNYDAATGEQKVELGKALANLKQDVSAKVADLKKLNVLPRPKNAPALASTVYAGTEGQQIALRNQQAALDEAKAKGVILPNENDIRASMARIREDIAAEAARSGAKVESPVAAEKTEKPEPKPASAETVEMRKQLEAKKAELEALVDKKYKDLSAKDRVHITELEKEIADLEPKLAEAMKTAPAAETKAPEAKEVTAKQKELDDTLSKKRDERTQLEAKIADLEKANAEIVDLETPQKAADTAASAYETAKKEYEDLKGSSIAPSAESAGTEGQRLALRNQQRVLDEAAAKGVVLQNENDIRASMARIRQDMAANGSPDTAQAEAEHAQKLTALEAKVKELEQAKRDAEAALATAKEKAAAAEAAKPTREKELASLKEKKGAMDADVKKIEEDVAREKAATPKETPADAKPAPASTETPAATETPAGEYDEADDLLAQRESVQTTAKEAHASAEKTLNETLTTLESHGFKEKFARLELVQTQLNAQAEELSAWNKQIVGVRTQEVFDRIQSVRGGRIDDEKAGKLRQLISARLIKAANDAAVDPAEAAVKEFRTALGTSSRKWGAALDTLTTVLLIKGLSVVATKAGAAYLGDANHADLLRPIPHKAPGSTIVQAMSPETPIQVQDSIWSTVQANANGLSNAKTLARTNRIIELANQKHLLGDTFGQLTASNFDAAGHLLSSGTDIRLTAEQLARVAADADIASILRGGALG